MDKFEALRAELRKRFGRYRHIIGRDGRLHVFGRRGPGDEPRFHCIGLAIDAAAELHETGRLSRADAIIPLSSRQGRIDILPSPPHTPP